MYRIKVNGRLTQYTMEHEHTARLVYGEIVSLAENGKLPIATRPQEVILYRIQKDDIEELAKWECERKPTSGLKGCPFPKKRRA